MYLQSPKIGNGQHFKATGNSPCTTEQRRLSYSSILSHRTENTFVLVRIQHIYYIYSTYTLHIQYIYITYTVHIQHTYNKYAVHTQYIILCSTHTIHMQYIYSTYAVLIHYICSTYTVYMQYIYSTYTVYMQYIYSTYTVHIVQYMYSTCICSTYAREYTITLQH